MANSFKLKTFDGSTTPANTAITAYTSPSATSAVVIGLTISNVDGQTVFLVKGAPVPSGGSIEIMNGNKIVLETGDGIVVYSNNANSIDTIVSVMEQS